MDESGLPADETSRNAATTPDGTTLLQRAFLLGQVAVAGEGGKTQGALNRAIGAAARHQLGLDAPVANRVRAELLERGYLAARKVGRQGSFVLTEAGRAYLAGLEKPVLPERAGRTAVDESAISDTVREAQKAFLLLQLLGAEGQALPKGRANRIPGALQKSLGLKPAVANHRRARLAEQGYIQVRRGGKSEEYVLTAHGVDYLAACGTHLAHATFSVRGATLNALVAAARESSFARDLTAGPVGGRPSATRQELAEAVLARFEELRRGKHGRSGLVPIHEVRQGIADRLGPDAARHEVLDDVILDLWRQGRVRLTAISDLRDATGQQLDDGIQGESQTFFYLETAHGQPAVL